MTTVKSDDLKAEDFLEILSNGLCPGCEAKDSGTVNFAPAGLSKVAPQFFCKACGLLYIIGGVLDLRKAKNSVLSLPFASDQQ